MAKKKITAGKFIVETEKVRERVIRGLCKKITEQQEIISKNPLLLTGGMSPAAVIARHKIENYQEEVDILADLDNADEIRSIIRNWGYWGLC